jgi:hypothetical protein
MVSCALTWRSVKRGILGAANAERTNDRSDQSVLLTVTIIGRLRRRPSANALRANFDLSKYLF